MKKFIEVNVLTVHYPLELCKEYQPHGFTFGVELWFVGEDDKIDVLF
jgi:hypothetical protein